MLIRLPPTFTDRHKVVARSFVQSERLEASDRKLLFEAFDILHRAEIEVDAERLTFVQVYEQRIEARFANEYLDALLQTDEIETRAEQLRAQTSRQIMPILRSWGLLDQNEPLSFYLLAYCLYWWYVFARGYAFEIEVFRDLSNSNIRYSSHNLLDPYERRSPFDLVLLGFRGDIKTSTYFLGAVRTTELLCDFYITRLFDAKGKRRTWVTFLQEQFWTVIRDVNLPVISMVLDDLVATKSGVFQVKVNQNTLIMLDYHIWKRLITTVQQEGEKQ